MNNNIEIAKHIVNILNIPEDAIRCVKILINLYQQASFDELLNDYYPIFTIPTENSVFDGVSDETMIKLFDLIYMHVA